MPVIAAWRPGLARRRGRLGTARGFHPLSPQIARSSAWGDRRMRPEAVLACRLVNLAEVPVSVPEHGGTKKVVLGGFHVNPCGMAEGRIGAACLVRGEHFRSATLSARA